MSASRESTLRQFDNLYDRLRLHRQVDARPIVVVEGESDKGVLNRIFEGRAMIFVATTRSNVIATARQVNDTAFARTACVIDRDFDPTIDELLLSVVCLFAWNGADLEQTLIASPSWPRLIAEFASAEKLTSAGGVETVHQNIVGIAETIGKLKGLNQRFSWGLPFDQVSIASKLALTTLHFNLPGYVAALRQASGSKVGIDAIQEKLRTADLMRCSSSGLTLASGKDSCAILAVALRRILGTNGHQGDLGTMLAKTLRLSIDVEWLRKLPLIAEIKLCLQLPKSIGPQSG